MGDDRLTKQQRYTERHPERVAESARLYRERHPQREAERAHLYRHTDGGRAVRRAHRIRYREVHPLETAARRKVEGALRTGRLVQQPCRDCGAEQAAAHHHRGYEPAFALDVVWLCAEHHRKEHTP